MSARPAQLGTSDEDLDVVMRAARVFSAVVASSLASCGDVVTWPQMRALVLIGTRREVTATQVATALDIHLSGASRMCDRLVAAGLIERNLSARDRRNVFLTTTSAGSDLLDKIMAHRRSAFTKILERMSASDRIALHHCLALFAEAAFEPPEDSFHHLDPGGAPPGDVGEDIG